MTGEYDGGVGVVREEDPSGGRSRTTMMGRWTTTTKKDRGVPSPEFTAVILAATPGARLYPFSSRHEGGEGEVEVPTPVATHWHRGREGGMMESVPMVASKPPSKQIMKTPLG